MADLTAAEAQRIWDASIGVRANEGHDTWGNDTCEIVATSRFMPALEQWLGRCGIEWEVIEEDKGRQTHTLRVGVREGHQTEWMEDKAGDVALWSCEAIGLGVLSPLLELGGGRALGRETRLTFKPPVIEFEEREVTHG